VPHLAALDRQHLTVRLPLPGEPDAIARAESLIRGFEAGGALVYETVTTNMGCEHLPEAYRAMLSRVCGELGIILVADEIGTGLNRLGAPFSSLRADRDAAIGEPDIVIAGKALTNGLYPLSVCLVRNRVMRQIERAQFASTYAAMPSGCAAALATLDYHERHALGPRAAATGALLETLLDTRLRRIDGVRRIAGAALERAVHLDWRTLAARQLSPFVMLSRLRDAGVFATLSPGEDHLMITPPLTIAHTHLDRAIAAIAAVLEGDPPDSVAAGTAPPR
jgi:adenosylmethionine-8-amino-7-oxononanoate aminotransferase